MAKAVDNTGDVEARLRLVEDKLAIYDLIAEHPPSADTGASDYLSTVWVDDGVFDRGDILGAEHGRHAIAELVATPAHQDSIKGGIAHVTGLPKVEIRGDEATVIHYILILVPQTQGDAVSVPNHGTSKGFRVHRVVASHWELVRTPEGWKYKYRTVRLMDGAEQGRELLKKALRRPMKVD